MKKIINRKGAEKLLVSATALLLVAISLLSLTMCAKVDLGEAESTSEKVTSVQESTVERTTEVETTETPTTETPTTEIPTTETPTTEAPTTEAPTTEAPTTEAPTTEAPTTEAPTTETPTTEAPTTEAPTTEAPTTDAPTEPPVTETQAPDGLVVPAVNANVIRIPEGKKVIALSFDDGPNKKYTPAVLDVLKKYNIHATFFVIGEYLEYKWAPDIVRRVVAEGHELASHTYDHSNLNKLSAASIAWEEKKAADNIYNICGVYPALMRAPGGSSNKTVQGIVRYPLIHWSVDTLDWSHRDADKVLQYVKSQAYDGGIILMHDRLTISAEATEKVIQWLLENDYIILSVGEMFTAKGITLEPGNIYHSTSYIRKK